MFDSFEKLTAEKRDLILSVCIDEFIRSGYSIANTVEMAKKCGIAKGSLFHYFGSKKSLFLYIIRICMDRVMNETRRAMSEIGDGKYFDRVRKSVNVKMTLPAKYPKETTLLSRAFSERGHEAAEELHAMSVDYAIQLKEINKTCIGEIEPDLIRSGVDENDARLFVQTVFDGVTARLLQRYAGAPQLLLDNTSIIADELEKAIDFILHGIGKRGTK